MPGLDPGIHEEIQQAKALRKISYWHGFMDCRVIGVPSTPSFWTAMPGNDSGKAEYAYACEINFTFM
jgi:hypothetical protein